MIYTSPINNFQSNNITLKYDDEDAVVSIKMLQEVCSIINKMQAEINLCDEFSKHGTHNTIHQINIETPIYRSTYKDALQVIKILEQNLVFLPEFYRSTEIFCNVIKNTELIELFTFNLKYRFIV